MLRRLVRHIPLISLLFAALPLPAAANPYAEYLTARILPGWREADGSHVAGLELTLAEGWKTYWRQPGSAGIPPLFNWSASDNLHGVEVIWPRPEVFELSGMRSIGYHDHVVLPLRIAPARAGAPVELRGEIFLGICEHICVPLEIEVAGTLPADQTRRSPAIAAALAERAYSATEAKVRAVSCQVRPQAPGLLVEAQIRMPSAGGREVTVFEPHLPDMVVSDSVSRREGDMLISQAVLSSSAGALHLDRSRLKITVLGQNYAVEIDGCPAR
ncbi:protein-disulfide reductase DsbD domain-containing protein [Pseudooceanicola sp. 200-1SW]|uniref:protein-disulfide reductase DsbD domain-containing protein n=1 Tax=Pseudooceanicola sp. 200-1SW TaxID=3425949 RepID=UPI003D7FC4B9